MTWLVLILLFVIFWAVCWWGSEIVFHPPKMLTNTIWPQHFGLQHELLRFDTADGVPISGWVIPSAERTDRTLLMLHGWGDNKGDLLQRTHYLSRRFNLVYIDYRNHGESGGSRSTIGFLESRDVEGAVEWLKRSRPQWLERIGIFGLSMGGALAIWTAARYPFLRCIATESPFPSFNKVVARYTYNGYRLPYFPFAWSTLQVIRWRLGEDPEPYSPIYHIEKVSPRPMLFIVGSSDTLIPVEDVKELYDRVCGPKELWVVENAPHGRCEAIAGAEYHRRLFEFFEKYL